MTNQNQLQKAPVYVAMVESMRGELGKITYATEDVSSFERKAKTYIATKSEIMEALQTPKGLSSGRLAIMKAREADLAPDGHYAHLVRYGQEINYQIDYKGLVKLMHESGKVKKVFADVVCENDDFEWNFGEVTKHKIDFRKDRGKPYLYYAVVILTNGEKQCHRMTKKEVDAIRAISKMPNGQPWTRHYDEMAKKCVIRQMSKLMDLSPALQKAIAFDNEEYQLVNVTPRKSRFERPELIEQEAPAFLTDANAELDQSAEMEQHDAEEV